MRMERVNLRAYDNSWYSPGRNAAWRALWLFVGSPLLGCGWITSSRFRAGLLRAFGARIGGDVVMRHPMRVKYPWHLAVGDSCWFGEDCWIDNLVSVTLGDNVCLSQAAYLCTGNHNWSDPCFGLIVRPISLGDGSWAGAHAILSPGVRMGVGAVAGAGSVVTRDIPDFEVHTGNPARLFKKRIIHPVGEVYPERQAVS